MGRASGTAHAVTGFDAVVGARRGHTRLNMAGSAPLTAAAAVHHNAAVLAAETGDTAPAFAILVAHHRDFSDGRDHNHLDELVHAIADAVTRDAEPVWLEETVALARHAGVLSHYAKHVVAFARGDKRYLHIWPDGHKVTGQRGPGSVEDAHTLCGKEMGAHNWHRESAGSWGKADNPFRRGRRCAKCERLAADSGITDLHVDSRDPLKNPERTAALRRAAHRVAARALRARLRAGQHSEREYRTTLEPQLADLALDTAADLAHEDAAWGLRNICAFADAAALTDGQDVTPETYDTWAAALTRDDWRELLQAHPDGTAALSAALADRINQRTAARHSRDR